VPHRLRTSVAAIVVVSALAACAAKEKEADRASTADQQSAQPSAAAAAPNVVTITAKDFSYDAPATIPAGLTTIRLVSNGQEMHHATLIKLEDGKSMADFAKAVQNPGPPPKWMVEFGGPNPPHPNGGVAETTQLLEPGNYVIACFVPSADGTPHLAKGMMRPITVVPSSTPSAPEPTADVTMTLTDYTFTLSKPLTAGKQVIRVEDAGPQPHEVILVRLAPGKTAADVAAWIEKMQGPPPGEPIGGVAALHNGGHAYITVDLTPGEYGLLCFLPDAKDGKPHVAHGMMKDIKI
jgi:hypothetical protein